MLNSVSRSFYASRTFIITGIISIAYLLLSAFLIGFKPEQVGLVLLFNTMYYAGSGPRKFITGFSIFIVYWILFDYMKAFPNYLFKDVSVEGLYHLEKQLFGIRHNGTLLTVNEYFNINHTTVVDVMAGLFYLCWVPVPLLFAAYLFVKKRRLFLEFALCFLLVNCIGFVLYYIVPAAPPWYVQQHGFVFIADTMGNTAGLQRFDDFFDVHIFSGLYAKSSNVFAAMPSLHSAYPVIVLWYGFKSRLRLANIFFAIVMLGIWTAAVYTSHHYVLDVLAGIACALFGLLLMRHLQTRDWFKRFVTAYLHKIS